MRGIRRSDRHTRALLGLVTLRDKNKKVYFNRRQKEKTESKSKHNSILHKDNDGLKYFSIKTSQLVGRGIRMRENVS